jgi:hypothetical protein
MKNVELKVGKQVSLPSYENMYELNVTYMHGDADGDTERTIHYGMDEEERLKQDLLIIDGLEDGEYLEDQAAEILAANGIEDPDNQIAEGFSDEFYEGDITCEGNGAPISGIELFFYDAKGVKHEVEFDVK